MFCHQLEEHVPQKAASKSVFEEMATQPRSFQTDISMGVTFYEESNMSNG